MWYLVIALVLVIVLGGGLLIRDNLRSKSEYHAQLELEERAHTRALTDLQMFYWEKDMEAEKGVREIMESYDNDKLDFDERLASYQSALEKCHNEINRLAELLVERNKTVQDMTVAIELLNNAMSEKEAEDAYINRAEFTRP